MAIHGISGKPGGGKSYEAVKSHVIPALKNGRKVVTNLPLQIDHFVAVYGEEVRDLIEVVDGNFHAYGAQRPFSKPEHFLKYDDWKNDKGQGVLFAVDECHLSMPSGRTQCEILEYLSMHRHYGHDVVLITQNFSKVHKDIRDMIGLVYRCIKKSFLGRDDAYILKIHEGCTRTVVNTKEREYEPYVFKFYKSHTKSDQSVEEAHTQDITPWWKHKIILFSAIPLGLALVLGSFNATKEKKVPTIPVKKSQAAESIEVKQTEPARLNNQSPQRLKNKPREVVPDFTERQKQYQEMVARSAKFHPFYKVNLSVSGFADYTDEGRRTKILYFSATQNGQHVFTISTRDLMLAGYDVRVLTDCSVQIKYYDFKDFLTCDAPRVNIETADHQLASNN